MKKSRINFKKDSRELKTFEQKKGKMQNIVRNLFQNKIEQIKLRECAVNHEMNLSESQK